jgi:hypothetical protein
VVKGIGYMKKISKKNNTVEPEDGHMHCGCAIEDVLMEFLFWKTWTATSTRSNFRVSEGMRDELVPARLRAFINQAFKKMTFLTLEDLYSPEYGSLEYEARLRLKQAARVLRSVNINEAESLEIEESRWGIVHSETAAGYLIQLAKQA